MSLGGQPIRTVAPTAYPLSLAEVKAHLRIDGNDEDALLGGYLASAVARAENSTGLGLLQQTWTQTFPAFASPMLLYRRPLLAVGSPAAAVTVAYLDSAGATQALSETFYRVTGIGADRAYGGVRLASGASWPPTYADEEAVKITYTVGFGTTGSAVPEEIRQAIKTMVSDWYLYRESLYQGSVDELPFGAEALLRPWRPLAVA